MKTSFANVPLNKSPGLPVYNAVRLILGLPYNAHTNLLGPFMGQTGIREQLYIRNFRFLWNGYRSNNYIIYTCISNALYNSNTCIGYKLAFLVVFSIIFNVDMDSNINSSISRLSISSMHGNQTAIVNNLKAMISVK